jgi:hypothetical protein
MEAERRSSRASVAVGGVQGHAEPPSLHETIPVT